MANFKLTQTKEQIQADLDLLDNNSATQGQILTANGAGGASWQEPSGGGTEVVQTTGQSTTAVMSQKAVTDELASKASTSYVQGNPLGSVTSTLNRLKIGDIIYTVPQGGGGGTTVVANPTLTGSEANLSGLQVGNTKYGIKALKVTIW